MAQQQPTPFPDTAHFLEAANDTARNFRAVYTTYLVIASYILVTILSTDDELLFRAGNVQMPIINTSVSVVWFFRIAPLILLLLHLNLLMQAMFLSTKVHRYTSRLAKENIHTRGLLFPAPLAHLLVAGDQRRVVQWIVWIVVFISLVVLPPGILIYTEIHFLTYQSGLDTWLHRAAILLDIILLWSIWPHIITPPDTGWKEWWRQSPWKRRATTTFASVATGLFVFVIADIPGGTMENFIPANALRDWLEPGLGRRYQLEEQILVQEEPPPEVLAAHLVACKSQNSDDRTDCQAEIKLGTPIWCQYAKPLPLQGRAFRHANLQKAVLCGVDLSVDDDADLSVDLSDADLSMARLHGADLRNTKLQGVKLRGIKLQGADLSSAWLPGADLREAELQGADLREAKLPGADLREAKLQGADLSSAWLPGADLREAELQGADLREAELQGADLREAKLQGADLSSAWLPGADLRKAELQGADLSAVELPGADLRDAELQGTNLSSAWLQGADLSKADLQGADLRWAKLQGADLSRTELQGADLSEAQLQGADLSFAGLQGADLSEAQLQGADLSKAQLQGADLRGAYLAGSDISNANLNLADLRDVDLESKPDQERLQNAIAIIKSITQQERRDQALELVKRAETEETTIAPYSIKDAIFNKDGALYKRLQEPENRALLRTRHFTQTWKDGYDTKLAAYLINSPSCGYEDNYVAERIIRSRILYAENRRSIVIFATNGRIIRSRIPDDENRKLTSIFAKKLNLDSKVPSLLCPGVEKPLDGLSERERTKLKVIFAEPANQ